MSWLHEWACLNGWKTYCVCYNCMHWSLLSNRMHVQFCLFVSFKVHPQLWLINLFGMPRACSRPSTNSTPYLPTSASCFDCCFYALELNCKQHCKIGHTLPLTCRTFLEAEITDSVHLWLRTWSIRAAIFGSNQSSPLRIDSKPKLSATTTKSPTVKTVGHNHKVTNSQVGTTTKSPAVGSVNRNHKVTNSQDSQNNHKVTNCRKC